MRTKKKNESGILNQNICGSNVGYKFRQEKDPIGGGYTFCNLAYPGKIYNIGNIFREKDMGNLLQLIFACGDYFRYRNTELVADSLFGHVVPVSYLRLWGVYCTTSLCPNRKGLWSIKELSGKKLEESEKKKLIDEAQIEEEKTEQKRNYKIEDLLETTSEEEVEKSKAKPFTQRKHLTRGLNSRLKIFERYLSRQPKGTFKVWSAGIKLGGNFNVKLFVHAVADSKVCYRLTTKHASKPLVPMQITDSDANGRKKRKFGIRTSSAHKVFRQEMGHNDQSDARRQRLGLSSRYYRRWPQKLFAKTWEDGTINAYNNYLIDPACPVEPWVSFLYNLVQEFQDAGEMMRQTKQNPNFKRSYLRSTISKRPIAGSDETLLIGQKCKGGHSMAAIKFLHFKKRSRACAYCGRKRACYKCRSCGMHLCMKIPSSSNRADIVYPENGPVCFQRFHGLKAYCQK